MEIIYPDLIAKALQLPLPQVRNTIGLLESGATIPFISRYRKEMTGGLNEVQITDVKNWLDKLTELKARKDTILNALEKQEKLTPELKARIESSWDSNEIEDIYLPYKPKRVTRAEMARKRGLEPLAKLIAAQKEPFLSGRVPAFVQGEVKDEEDALSGARDIIAEWVNENERTRNQVRFAFRQAVISAKVIKGKEEDGAKYRNYFQFEEKLSRCQSHRLLAVRRGEEEGFLRVSIAPADDDACLESLYRQYKRNNGACWEQFQLAIDDAYKRLLKPSIESEFAKSSKLKADEEAIRVFADNLRQLLLAPP